MPTLSESVKYLRGIEERRWYTNFGPLVTALETRLAEHFALPPGNAALVANGTTGLSAALLAAGAQPGKKCLLPSWTFVASAGAIWAANLIPHFVDVSAETWAVDPDFVRRRSDLSDIGAVMPISPFGSPVDTQAWDTFSNETGIPVVIDAAAAFDTVSSITQSRPARTPTVISLHATKALGMGEGGLVLSTSGDFIRRLRQVCNFGLWGPPDDQILGYNGKVSEYHAAIGLAALDAWPDRRIALQSITDRYAAALRTLPRVDLTPQYGQGWVSAYCTVLVPGEAGTVADRMTAEGIETRRWWHKGVAAQQAYRDFPSDPLPVTGEIAARALSLPFFHDMGDAAIDAVAGALKRALPQ